MFHLLIFIFGLFVGSFLNCLIYRFAPHHFDGMPKGKPTSLKDGISNEKLMPYQSGGGLKGRSFCPQCRHQLIWRDLIPLLSFLILKRKCRYCQQKISLQYPLVELSTGVLFVSIFQLTISNQRLTIPSILDICYLFLVSCFLIIIFVYDLKHYIIPDKVIYPAILVSCIWYFVFSIFFNFYTRYEILNTIYSAIGAAVFFLMIVLVSRGKWMGVGDIKLAFLMGLFLGFPNILVALFLAFFIGAIIGIGLIALGKKTLRSEVPFGPFLVTGTFLTLFGGEKLINWYLILITY